LLLDGDTSRVSAGNSAFGDLYGLSIVMYALLSNSGQATNVTVQRAATKDSQLAIRLTSPLRCNGLFVA
jgi:hypothetical protein